MNFADVKRLVITNGEVATIARGAEILWRKQKYKKELLYLESTGTQYIDTEYVPNNNSAVDLRGSFDCTSATTRFGARSGYTGASVDGAFAVLAVSNNTFRIDYGSGAIKPTQWTPSAKQANRIVIDGTTKSTTIYFTDGTSESNTYSVGDFTLSHSALIFAFNDNGSPAIAKGMKVSSCKLYDNGNLIRDLILVLDWDDVPCMYDKVSGELFYNQGTGEFSYE